MLLKFWVFTVLQEIVSCQNANAQILLFDCYNQIRLGYFHWFEFKEVLFKLFNERTSTFGVGYISSIANTQL